MVYRDVSEAYWKMGDRARAIDVFKDDPSFVVHPPFGKWVIAGGEWLFGVTPFGWRFAVAVLGTLSILMAARIARRLTRSDLVGTVTGLLVALYDRPRAAVLSEAVPAETSLPREMSIQTSRIAVA